MANETEVSVYIRRNGDGPSGYRLLATVAVEDNSNVLVVESDDLDFEPSEDYLRRKAIPGRQVGQATPDQALATLNQRVAVLKDLGFELERIFLLPSDAMGFTLKPKVLLHWHLSLTPETLGRDSAAKAMLIQTCAEAARLSCYRHNLNEGVLFQASEAELKVSEVVGPNVFDPDLNAAFGSMTANDMLMFALIMKLRVSGAVKLELVDSEGDNLQSPSSYNEALSLLRKVGGSDDDFREASISIGLITPVDFTVIETEEEIFF